MAVKKKSEKNGTRTREVNSNKEIKEQIDTLLE